MKEDKNSNNTNSQTKTTTNDKKKRERESPETEKTNKKQKDMAAGEQKLDLLISAMENLTTQIKEMKTQLYNIETKVDRIGCDVEVLKNKQEINEDRFHKIDGELTNIKHHIDASTKMHNTIEQNLCNNDVQITNVPSTYDKKQEELIMILNNFTGTNLTSKAFKRISFFNKKKLATCNVILSFHNSMDKASLMKNVKKLSTDENGKRIPITIDDVFEEFKNNQLAGKQLFINNVLTKHNKEILKLKRTYKNEIKFMWEQDGRILMKRNESSRIVEATSPQHVEEYAKLKHH